MTVKLSLACTLVACIAMPVLAQVRVQAGGTNVVIDGGGGVVVNGGADVSVGAGKVDVRTGDAASVHIKEGSTSVGKGNLAGSSVGAIVPGNQEGVSVLNGRVYIDGKEIPTSVTRYKSPRTGQVYIIRREGGSVAVATE